MKRQSACYLPVICLTAVALFSASLVPGAVAAAAAAGAAAPKILIISTQGYGNTDFIEQILTNYTIPYEVVRYERGAPTRNLTALLWSDADGSPRFTGIVMCVDTGTVAARD